LKMVFPNGISITTSDPDSGRQFDCPKCRDTGYVIIDKPSLTVRECECVTRKANQRRLERSGLTELVDRCTFDSFTTELDYQIALKNKALAFLTAPKGSWFFVGGHSGSGKTHICTAVCKELIDRGNDVLYFKWREEAPRLKALINDSDRYYSETRRISDVQVLYIDDFLKGSIREADINLAYQLLNDRYNTRKTTIISSERSIEDIAKFDEAVGSRIYERSKGYCCLTPNVNLRLKN